MDWANLLGHQCLSINVIVANRVSKEFTKDGAATVENLIQKHIGNNRFYLAMQLNFFKYQGTGNDFIILNNLNSQISLSTEQVLSCATGNLELVPTD